jgi:hypothetical protein
MVVIPSNELENIYYSDIIYKLNIARQKIKFFENKYKNNFSDFEKYINNCAEENYLEWDDYIEWKAFTKMFAVLNLEKNAIKDGNIKIN